MNRTLDVVTSYAASVARGGVGQYVGPLGPRPARTLELYEFEACPFCRKTREALTMLDLDALIYPCPKGGTRFRPAVVERGGKAQFPYLVDPNAGVAMYESDAIVAHLYARYGAGRAPFALRTKSLATVTSAAASAMRPGRGGLARRSMQPAKVLELWSFEVSPYCRIVREALSALELPYLLHNVAKGSPSRAAFVARSGRQLVPFLVDPNTGREMFESAEIVKYLESTYGRA